MSLMMNMRTGKTDEVNLATATVAELRDYFPQVPAAFGLFEVRLAQGAPPLVALEDTLRACVPSGV